jgi:tetratricopeptide (TPR) repeat protein
MFQGKQYCEVIPEIELLKNKGFNNFYMERMLTYSCFECATAADGAKKGLEASDRFFKMVPQESIIYMDYKYKGLLLSKSGSDSLAVLELEKASELDKDAARELAGDIGRLYMKIKKYDKVVAAYEFKRGTLALSATEQFELGRAYFFGPKDYVKADSAFVRLIELSPTYTPGYYWRARVAYQLDPTKANWMAKPYLEKVIELVKPEERMAGPNKAMVMEAAKYLGDYYVNSKEKDIAKARTYWNIVKEMDPADNQALAFFKTHGN